MREQRENRSDESGDLRDALLDIHLQETVGGLRPPDLRLRLLGSSPEDRAAASARLAATAPASGSLRRWLSAAVLLFGTLVILAILTAEDPDAGEPVPAAQAANEVVVRSVPDLQQQIAGLQRVAVTGMPVGLPGDLRELMELCRADLPAALVTRVKAELRAGLPLENGALYAPEHELRFYLAKDRYIRGALGAPGSRRLRIHTLGDLQITAGLEQLLRPIVDDTVHRTRLRGGQVRGRADLLRRGEVAIPRDVIYLHCSGLVDADLELLAPFRKLQHLNLDNCAREMDGSGLRHLLALPELRRLSARYNRIEDDALAVLAAHPRLEELDVSSAQVLTGVGLGAFAGSRGLRRLKLGFAGALTDQGLAAVARVGSLRSLDLSGNRFDGQTVEGLRRLGELSNLRELKLFRVPLPMDELLPALATLRHLESLDLSLTDVGPAALRGLLDGWRAADLRIPPLTELLLTGCRRIGPGSLQHLSGFLKLRHLKLDRTALNRAPAGGDSGAETGDPTVREMSYLPALKELRRLSMRSVPLDAKDMAYIAGLPELTQLDISSAGTGVDDAALAHLGRAKGLTELSLVGNAGFTDQGLRSLLALGSLRHLTVSICPGITDDGIAMVKERLPGCTIVAADRPRLR